MFECYIKAVRTDSAGNEEPAATRERLRTQFAAGAVRRMTRLGLLVGSLVRELDPDEDTAVVYATQFGEGRALEAYLDSFPGASPTLFQTSIHPSGVQQGLIGRQRPVGELLPISGGTGLPGHALLAALAAPAPSVLFCGGEERGTWLVEVGAASDRTFAFALSLSRESSEPNVGKITLHPAGSDGAGLTLAEWFDLLHERRAFDGIIAPAWHCRLEWS